MFELDQNYSNAFNPETVIQYRLDAASEVRLVIYNVLGQQVREADECVTIAGCVCGAL